METTMTHRLLQRCISLGLSAVLTLAMLGSVNYLAQPDEAAPQWAQQSTPRA
jgi:hypothetical protein